MKVKFMLRLMKNRRGTAEVIGTIMAIVILLFFFTNVYLWHDAVTKQMDNMYVQKMNTLITLILSPETSSLNVTDTGGSDATLFALWINVESLTGGPDIAHYCVYSVDNINVNNVVVQPGVPYSIPLPQVPGSDTIVFTVVTTLGNMASCYYRPGS